MTDITTTDNDEVIDRDSGVFDGPLAFGMILSE